MAEDLAGRSDAIADALDAGDICTAAVRADELQEATVSAINNGQVPQEFQEDLQARANELVNAVNCPPPPPTTTEEDENQSGEGKGRGKKKGGEDGEEPPENDAVVTIPPPTEVIP